MSLLNLSFAEFAAVFTAVSAVMVALYLLDRSRRRVVASTLRFWKPAGPAPQERHKRRIQQPWSLLLQLLSIAALLLAIGQLQWGTRNRGRGHVLLLDTSAWMNARTPKGTLMDEARRLALAYVKSLPSADRVLVVRADGLATPAGVLESNRAAIERQIRDSAAGPSALNLSQAFAFARQFQRMHSNNPGEIVFAGAGRVSSTDPAAAPPPNLRVLPVDTAAIENVGLRRVGLKRSDADPSAWDVFVASRNYGSAPRNVPLELRFGGAIMGARMLTLKPGEDQETTFTVRTRAAGMLEARLVASDALPEDDRCAIEVPEQRKVKVLVFTPQPDSLRPLLAANPHVDAQFRSPSTYAAGHDADVLVFDEFAPPDAPSTPAIWIEPPRNSPFRAKTTVQKAKLKGWNTDHEVGAGLRNTDAEIEGAEVFSTAPGDVAIAEVEQGPVIVAREAAGSPRAVAFGFHPVRSGMRYDLATPLIFANTLRWIHPELFRSWELNAGAVGTVTAALGKEVDPASVAVRSDAGTPVPYTIDNGRLQFFAAKPGNIRVAHGDREIAYSLNLPQVGDTAWKAPDGVRRGVPRRTVPDAVPTDLWPWLAAFGALGLAVEWVMYGRGQRRVRAHAPHTGQPAQAAWRKRAAS